jgi:phytoene synthase
MVGAEMGGVRALITWSSTREPQAGALQDWLPPAGSDLYYALRYLPPAVRASLTVIEAFRRHLVNLPLECSNLEIARAKLGWWHGELHTLESARSQHVLIRALAPIAAQHPALRAALFALVDGVAGLLDEPRFASADSRHAAYLRVHGPLWTVHAAVSGLTVPAEIAAMCRLGVAIELAYGLRDLRRVIDAGLTWLCRAHEPTAEIPPAHADWYAAVAQRELPYLRDELQAAQRAMPCRGDHARACRVVLVLGELAQMMLAEIAADGYRVWERRVELTPLRKLLRTLKIRSVT